MSSKTVAVFFGTRPEIVKLGPLIRILGDAAHLVHTGQHFDNELSRLIAEDMSIELPKETLGVGASSRAVQIGRALIDSELVVAGSDAVVVQGDTNSALAGALAANARNVPLFHVEAGLRSYDRRMPEEHNRVVVDHLADMCWAPTEGNVRNLTAEGIPPERIVQTGNSIVEALGEVSPSPKETTAIREKHKVMNRQYALVTLHRPENVDDPQRLERLLIELASVSVPVVFPMHPRTMATIVSAGLEPLLANMRVMPPVGYKEFLGLLSGCRLAISDSGGVQEEVSILKVPLIVVRRSTERPEVLGSFAQLTDDPGEMLELSNKIIDRGDALLAELALIPTPYGDGSASRTMADSIRRILEW